MNATKRTVYLILLGVAALVLGLVVLVGSENWREHALAAGLVVGGLAMIVVALPTRNGNGH